MVQMVQMVVQVVGEGGGGAFLQQQRQYEYRLQSTKYVGT